jgi:hypothetical protein
VVRDDVEDLAELVLAEGGTHPGVPFLTAQLDVDPAVVDDVVAVGRPVRRLQVGRGVEVAHPEAVEVGGHGRDVVEPEGRLELDTVRREWPGIASSFG